MNSTWESYGFLRGKIRQLYSPWNYCQKTSQVPRPLILQCAQKAVFPKKLKRPCDLLLAMKFFLTRGERERSKHVCERTSERRQVYCSSKMEKVWLSHEATHLQCRLILVFHYKNITWLLFLKVVWHFQHDYFFW